MDCDLAVASLAPGAVGDATGGSRGDVIRDASIPAYFALRVLSAILLLKLSSLFLDVQGFANFMQFIAFSSLLNMAVVGGAQNGLIRQAAAASDAELSDVHGAGLAVCMIAVPVIGIPAAVFSREISQVLTGSGSFGQEIIGLTLLSLTAGPGQVCWSVLSGRKMVAQSLGAQSVGLVIGTAAAAWFIVRGRYPAAALVFAAVPLVGGTAALPFTAFLHLKWRPTRQGLGDLLGYSAAIASTLGFTALTLFALRSLYREQFGTTELGYWLAANRISDMSTQFVGLFMLQAFVPQLATASSPEDRRRLILRYGSIAAGLMGAALLVFLVASGPLVRLFLSSAYLPAISGIRLYMTGDFLRVWASLAMFTAFANGRPARFAAIEIATMGLMAVLTLALIAADEVHAPQIAYVAAYAITALIIGVAALLRSLQMRRASLAS
jgi:O-antigen/teichoic acid export membrane protein